MSPLAKSRATETQACVWMTAGLLSYKLCDRRFDCEHCPLDAALRGGFGTSLQRGRVTTKPAADAELFPDDRHYTLGHTWLKLPREGEVRMRFGLDHFAASLISCPRRVRWTRPSRLLGRRATVCELELDEGVLRLCTPIAARPRRRNRVLVEDPGAIVNAPYEQGWIVELVPEEIKDIAGLISPQKASEHARHDLQCLRRHIAHHLLAETGPDDWINAEGAAALADLRLMLGAPVYLQLVRELVR